MNLRVRRKSCSILDRYRTAELVRCWKKEIDERRELERTQYGIMQEDALAS